MRKRPKMKKMTLTELEENFQVVEMQEQAMYVGGYGCNYGTSFYTYDQFEYKINNGTWGGGFVEGMGFVLPEFVVNGSAGGGNYGGNASGLAGLVYSAILDVYHLAAHNEMVQIVKVSGMNSHAINLQNISIGARVLKVIPYGADVVLIAIAMHKDGGWGPNAQNTAVNAVGGWAGAWAGAKFGAKWGKPGGIKGVVIGGFIGGAVGAAIPGWFR